MQIEIDTTFNLLPNCISIPFFLSFTQSLFCSEYKDVLQSPDLSLYHIISFQTSDLYGRKKKY